MGTPCKCSASEERINRQQPARYFQNAVQKFQERHGNMLRRQEILKAKIDTMEKSIPALMAYNMWTCGKKCTDAPLCKVKEIMDKFSPIPNPADKLLDKLKNTVAALNAETDKLHGGIIDKEIELEEKGMELDSLELANKALEDRLKDLENELKINIVPSLHSIHSEDLICLSKIRKLGHEEVNLKSCIQELEEKEATFRRQMEELLTSPEFQKDSGGKKMIKRIQELETTERQMNCSLQTHKYNMHQLKKKLMQKEKEINKMEMFFENVAAGKVMNCSNVTRHNKQIKNKKDVAKNKSSWLPRWMLPSTSTAAESEEKSSSVKKVTSFAAFPGTSDEKMKGCVCKTPAPVPCYEKPFCQADAVPKTCRAPNSHEPPPRAISECSQPAPSARPPSGFLPKCHESSCCPCPKFPQTRSCPASARCTAPAQKSSSCQSTRRTLPHFSSTGQKPPACPSTKSSAHPLPSSCKPVSCALTQFSKSALRSSSPVSKLAARTSASYNASPSTFSPPVACCINNPLCQPPECFRSSQFPGPNPGKLSTLECPNVRCGRNVSFKPFPNQNCTRAPCDTRSLCSSSHFPTPCKPYAPLSKDGGCRCSCKGKCSRGESDIPCNCSVTPTSKADKGYQPKGQPKPSSGGSAAVRLKEVSEDEFCECCDCGCNESIDSTE